MPNKELNWTVLAHKYKKYTGFPKRLFRDGRKSVRQSNTQWLKTASHLAGDKTVVAGFDWVHLSYNAGWCKVPHTCKLTPWANGETQGHDLARYRHWLHHAVTEDFTSGKCQEVPGNGVRISLQHPAGNQKQDISDGYSAGSRLEVRMSTFSIRVPESECQFSSWFQLPAKVHPGK